MSTDVSTAKPKREIPVGLIDDARKHVYEAAIRTPLLRLNYEGPAEIYLKLECLQPIGSFKIRGAYNAVRLLPEEQRKRGVWTVSAGNAAQGVALAARKAGVPCKVLVMDTAPVAKLDAGTASGRGDREGFLRSMLAGAGGSDASRHERIVCASF